MDATSFLALYKASVSLYTSGSERLPGGTGDIHPLMMAVCVYVQGLGYDVVLRGSDAERYIAMCDGTEGEEKESVPARCWQSSLGDDARPSTDTSQGEDKPMYCENINTLVMDAEYPEEGTVEIQQRRTVLDQLSLRGIITEESVIVHCERKAWASCASNRNDPWTERTPSGVPGGTCCTVPGSAVLEIPLSPFYENNSNRDRTFGLKNIDNLLSRLAKGFCRGSRRTHSTNGETCGRGQSPSTLHEGGSTAEEGSRHSSDIYDIGVGYNDVRPTGVGIPARGGGMMVGPHHPIFGRGRLEPPSGHEGHLPPGARWDPIAPPGMRGFFPGDFERRGSGRRGEIHPDIMQPGRTDDDHDVIM
jgi:hypothetical protein